MPDDLLTGADYRAVRRVSDGPDNTVADVGETCERVDPAALPWLLAQGHIVPIAAEKGTV